MSDADKVREFTDGSQGSVLHQPNPMNQQEVSFIVSMVLSEIVELVQTVCETDKEVIDFIIQRVKTDLNQYERSDDEDVIASDQADAAVDMIYYLYNCFGKKGINLSRVFDLVHEANMAKRDPKTGKFIRRELDGKILKPKHWKPPDILSEIKRQKIEGSWN